jgi:hypothetical protein
MQGEPVIQAMGLDVVHGKANDRKRGRCVIVGTLSYPGHVLEHKRSRPECGYPGGMKSLVLVAAILAGCGGHGDPVDAEGMWTVSLTNRANDCNVQSWNEGESASVTVSITQNGEAVLLDITGFSGG